MAARCFILILALSGCAPEESEPIPPPPNILIVLTDDQGWGDLGINGNSNIRTPNLDSLAISGARFEQFYVQPVCSPTRAEILTGRYAAALGVYSTSAGGERMDPGVPTLGDVFRDAGYRTGLFGKWHNGSQPPYHPNFRGFDEFYGFASGHWAHYFSPELEHNGKFVRGEGYLADDLTARAIQFMGAPDPRPFLAVLTYNTPHSPMQVPDPYWDALQNRPLEMRHREPQLEDTLFTRAALAMVENIDANVGQVVEFLEKSGTRRETIVVFLSDNGPNSSRWNGGMKGRKGSTDEGGVRSPLLISWPGSIPAGLRVRSLGGSVDLLPTLVGLSGIQETRSSWDGQDLSAAVLGKPNFQRDGYLYNYWNGALSLRSRDFRLDAENRLFDMRRDPGQTTDVSGEHPQAYDSLVEAKAAWLASEVPKDFPERPFTVGYPGAGRTVLPARDATVLPPLRRSNKYPNASYITGWENEAGLVYWPVEVLSDGTYEISCYYACPATAIGLPVWIASGGDMTGTQIRSAFDSEIYGAEQDRVPRIESYARDFRKLPLGRLELRQGTDTLRLRAGPFPDRARWDVQRLVLEKID